MKNFFMKIKDNVTNDIRTVKALKGVSSKKKTRVYIKLGLLLLLILLLIFLPIGCSSCGRKSDKNKIEDSTETQTKTEYETESETQSESETESETGSETKPGSNSSTKKPVKKPEPETVPKDKPSTVLPGNKKPENSTEVLPTDKPEIEETTKANDEKPTNPSKPDESTTEKETDPIIIVRPTVPSTEGESEKITISDDMENPYEEMETVEPFPVETQPQPTEPETEPETQPETVTVQFKRVDGAGIINAYINPSGIGRDVRGYWVYADGSTCAAASTTNGYRIIYKFGIDYNAVKLVVVVDGKEFIFNI